MQKCKGKEKCICIVKIYDNLYADTWPHSLCYNYPLKQEPLYIWIEKWHWLPEMKFLWLTLYILKIYGNRKCVTKTTTCLINEQKTAQDYQWVIITARKSLSQRRVYKFRNRKSFINEVVFFRGRCIIVENKSTPIQLASITNMFQNSISLFLLYKFNKFCVLSVTRRLMINFLCNALFSKLFLWMQQCKNSDNYLFFSLYWSVSRLTLILWKWNMTG